MKTWLCAHGFHHIIILEVDDYCNWGDHWMDERPPDVLG